MTRIGIVALLIVLHTTPARAQRDIAGRAVLYGATAADLITTRWAIKNGAKEANPFAPKSLKGQVVHSIAFSVGMDVIAHRWGRGSGRWTRFAFGFVKFGVAAHNVRAIKR
jgi:hypothetical protein